MQALLDQAIVNNRPFADLGEIKLTVEPVDAGLDCIVDGDRFQQVLSNLLSNAVKFSPAGASVEIATQVSTIPPLRQNPKVLVGDDAEVV